MAEPSTPLPEQGGFDRRLDEILAELVGTPVEFVHLNVGVPEFKAAIRTLIAEEICEDYPKDWSYDDPEFVAYANIEHDRQREKLGEP